MNKVFLLARKDFIRKWRNPVVIIGFLLIPLLFSFILGIIFGPSEEETLPRIRVLAVDKDQSFFSEFLLNSFKQGELNEMIELKKVEEEEGRKLMDRGKASALLIIPQNFEENIWNRKPVELSLLKNPSEQFLPQVVEEICDIASLVFSAIFSVFSDELGTIKSFIDIEEFPDIEISSLAVQIKHRIEGISKYVFPPVITIKQRTIEEKEEEEETPISVYGYILPAMAVMFLLFICNIVFEDLLREKEKGTLLRMSISPMKIADFVWSKILTSAIIGIICTLTLVILGRIIFSIRWGNPFSVFLIILSLNILIAGLISFLYSFVRTERQAGAVVTPVVLVMSLLGGSMMPAENFPPFILNFSKLTVNYWGIKAFHLTVVGEGFQRVFPILIGMVFAGILLSLIGSYFLNRSLRRGLFK
ncbi:MAG: ABC transporter permease [Candidatus Aminicenantes bacterium]|nr:MAG: ABC transporter permease [Candidatus Aminicenantes bacterium]